MRNDGVTSPFSFWFAECIADYWQLWPQLRAKSNADGAVGYSGRSFDHVERLAIHQTRNESDPAQQERHCHQPGSTWHPRKTFKSRNFLFNEDKMLNPILE